MSDDLLATVTRFLAEPSPQLVQRVPNEINIRGSIGLP